MKFRHLLRRSIPVDWAVPSDLPRTLLTAAGYFRARTWLGARGQTIPDSALYRPLYSPWLGEVEFERHYRMIRPHTLASRYAAYILCRTLKQAIHLDGDCVECGVFRGGTALLEADTLARSTKMLHLFDSFVGMPSSTDEGESFRPGDFSRTSLKEVSELLAPYPRVCFHPGFIPDTFKTAPIAKLAWAHVDVDLYQSVKDCIEWIYPRLTAGGYMILDDYGYPSCSGARRAADEALADKPEIPVCLSSGQCLIVKLPAAAGESSA